MGVEFKQLMGEFLSVIDVLIKAAVVLFLINMLVRSARYHWMSDKEEFGNSTSVDRDLYPLIRDTSLIIGAIILGAWILLEVFNF